MFIPIHFLHSQDEENASLLEREFIRKYTSDSSMKLYISQSPTMVSYILDEGDDEFNYFPNMKLKTGIGGSWKSLSFSWGYGIDLLREAKKGKTTSTEFQFNYYGKSFIVESSMQKYSGFYLIEDLDNWQENMDDIVLRPDIKLNKYAVFSQYIFNSNHFSYRAPFGQRERQLISSGSLQIGFGIYHTETMADSTFHPVQPIVAKQHLKSTQLGPNIGYTYTWVLKKFFITASLTTGLHLDIIYSNNVKQPRKFSPTFYPRFYGGYNANDWSINVSAKNNRIYISSDEDARIGLNSIHMELTFVRRFNSHFRPKLFDSINPKILKFIGLD